MASVLSYLRELNIVTMMLRILLAVLCGGLIGLERERKNRPAGFRTYMLTALGATLTVLLSLQLDQMLHGPWRALAESIGATQDVSRFGAEADEDVRAEARGAALRLALGADHAAADDGQRQPDENGPEAQGADGVKTMQHGTASFLRSLR